MVNATPRPLYPRETDLVPWYRRPDRYQNRSGRVRKISPPPEFDTRSILPVASRCTNYAAHTHTHIYTPIYICIYMYVTQISSTGSCVRSNETLDSVNDTVISPVEWLSASQILLFPASFSATIHKSYYKSSDVRTARNRKTIRPCC